MLVLSRYVGEKIIVTSPDGTQITITLMDIGKTKSRIGIAAPTSYAVNREEIQQRISANGK
jgi:carbon storage regulator CsrA